MLIKRAKHVLNIKLIILTGLKLRDKNLLRLVEPSLNDV
jgi:hypothetical protein